MFTAAFFTEAMWDDSFWPSADPTLSTTTLSTTWLDTDGDPFASQSLDYVVKDATNGVIASGTAATDGAGVLTVSVSAAYAGQSLLIHVENVSSTMVTTGKFHGTQVAVAA